MRFIRAARSSFLPSAELLADMVGDVQQFLAPDTCDFFYLTAR
jgi:hypothetical protein